jgi:hypothetical protein
MDNHEYSWDFFKSRLAQMQNRRDDFAQIPSEIVTKLIEGLKVMEILTTGPNDSIMEGVTKILVRVRFDLRF